LATAIFSFGIGVLAQPATAHTAAAIVAHRTHIEVSAFMFVPPKVESHRYGSESLPCVDSKRSGVIIVRDIPNRLDIRAGWSTRIQWTPSQFIAALLHADSNVGRRQAALQE
jgi:hypothetical protein